MTVRAILFLLTISVSPGVWSETADDFSRGLHERLSQQRADLVEQHYSDAIDEFDRRIAAFPHSVVVRVEKCRYIQQAVYSEDYYVEGTEDDFTKCQAALEPYAAHPEVRLFELEALYGDEAVTTALDIAAENLDQWTPYQESRLYRALSFGLQPVFETGNNPEADRRAHQSYALYSSRATQLRAARHMLNEGDVSQARAILDESPADKDSDYYVDHTEHALLLLEIDEAGRAKQLLANWQSEGIYTETDRIAFAFAEQGDYAYGLAQIEAGIEEWNAQSRLEVLLEYARRWGNEDDVLSAYERLRNQGYMADPLARHRLAIALEHPALPWRLRDIPGLLTLLALMAAVAALPLLFILPIHYRGLARRIAGKPPGTFGSSRCRLRDAWAVSAALAIVMLCLQLAFYYEAVETYVEDSPYAVHVAESISGEKLAHGFSWYIAIASIIAALALLRLGRQTLGTTLSASRMAGLCALSMLGIWFSGFVFQILLRPDSGLFEQPGALAWQIRFFQALNETYGLAATIAIVALLVPLVEEILCRGVLLTAFSRHISFAGANVVQAIVFGLLHGLEFALHFTVVGLILGLLHRRGGGLAAPIIVHAINNLIAVTLVLYLFGSVEL